MPRKLRIEYEGAVYHVMNRGGSGTGYLKSALMKWFAGDEPFSRAIHVRH